MARIVVTTFGSTGDLNPFIALGFALRARGHDVIFAVEANFEPQLNLLGFPVRLLTGDQEKALAPFRTRSLTLPSRLTRYHSYWTNTFFRPFPEKLLNFAKFAKK